MAKTEQKSPEWLSTYGILTAERILERFKIQLTRDELLNTLTDDTSHYHHLVSVPIKNIFNGILSNQINDYQIYAQKLMIDYKLADTSPSVIEGEEQPPKPTSTQSEEELEEKHTELIDLGTAFDDKVDEHYQLISESQAWLINEAPKQESLATSEDMSGFGARAQQMMYDFLGFRDSFRTLILDITTLLSLAPDYFLDPERLTENQQALDFDPNLTTEED